MKLAYYIDEDMTEMGTVGRFWVHAMLFEAIRLLQYFNGINVLNTGLHLHFDYQVMGSGETPMNEPAIGVPVNDRVVSYRNSATGKMFPSAFVAIWGNLLLMDVDSVCEPILPQRLLCTVTGLILCKPTRITILVCSHQMADLFPLVTSFRD